MANKTFIEIPQNVSDPLALRIFLQRLIEKLDVVFGNRNTAKFVSGTDLNNSVSGLAGTILNSEDVLILISDNSTDNNKQSNITDATNITSAISGTYVQSEIVDLKNGVDENKGKINSILQLLKDADLMET